jgi:hypothetical protein
MSAGNDFSRSQLFVTSIDAGLIESRTDEGNDETAAGGADEDAVATAALRCLFGGTGLVSTGAVS